MTQKLFWEHPYQKEFTATISDITEKGVLLDKTLFYPASGGQAGDKGILSFAGKKYEVKKVSDTEKGILHELNGYKKESSHIGQEISGIIDWSRRYNLMKSHTLQHLISSIILAKTSSKTNHVSIDPDSLRIDLDTSISFDQLKEIMEEVTFNCFTSRKVKSIVLPLSEAINDYKDIIRGTMTTEDPVRLVIIDDKDIICCGGTHLENTNEIGIFFIDYFKNGQKLKITIGNQAIIKYNAASVNLLRAMSLLNENPSSIFKIMEKKLKEEENTNERISNLSYLYLDLFSKTDGVISSEKGTIYYSEAPIDRKLIMSVLKIFINDAIIILKPEPAILQVYSKSENVKANELVDAFIERYGGKGGGNPKIAQCMVEYDPDDIIGFVERYMNRR